MSRKPNQQPSAKAIQQNAITEYLIALQNIYPVAKGTARVLKRQDNRIIVSIALPTRVNERMRLFDHMAEVGTKLLLETNEYIILSSQ